MIGIDGFSENFFNLKTSLQEFNPHVLLGVKEFNADKKGFPFLNAKSTEIIHKSTISAVNTEETITIDAKLEARTIGHTYTMPEINVKEFSEKFNLLLSSVTKEITTDVNSYIAATILPVQLMYALKIEFREIENNYPYTIQINAINIESEYIENKNINYSLLINSDVKAYSYYLSQVYSLLEINDKLNLSAKDIQMNYLPDEIIQNKQVQNNITLQTEIASTSKQSDIPTLINQLVSTLEIQNNVVIESKISANDVSIVASYSDRINLYETDEVEIDYSIQKGWNLVKIAYPYIGTTLMRVSDLLSLIEMETEESSTDLIELVVLREGEIEKTFINYEEYQTPINDDNNFYLGEIKDEKIIGKVVMIKAKKDFNFKITKE